MESEQPENPSDNTTKGGNDYLATMLAGASAGCCARVVTYPIDTCKARIQVRKPDTGSSMPGATGPNTNGASAKPSAQSASLSRALRSEIGAIVAQDGVRGFYRGFMFSFVGSIPAGMLYFTCYEAARDAMQVCLLKAG